MTEMVAHSYKCDPEEPEKGPRAAAAPPNSRLLHFFEPAPNTEQTDQI